MAKLDLQVRDLNTGDGTIASFESEEAAITWLRARPRFVDVLGVATVDLSKETNDRLKAALRPLDADEQARETALEDAIAEASRARSEAKQKSDEAAALAHRAAQASADPNRPMEVHFRYDSDLSPTDPADTRAITQEMREAVMAWVAERNEWIAARGQVVGDAKVTVWPGPLPASADGERVKTGTFIPVTAPAADPS